EEHLVMPPILDDPDRRSSIMVLDRERNDPDQSAAAAHLDEPDAAPDSDRREGGGDEPGFAEAVGLRGLVGQRVPVLGEILAELFMDVDMDRPGSGRAESLGGN